MTNIHITPVRPHIHPPLPDTQTKHITLTWSMRDSRAEPTSNSDAPPSAAGAASAGASAAAGAAL